MTADGVCFSGDLVLGAGSTIVPPDGGSLTAYMHSLHLLQAEEPDLICPGHGPWITEPAAKLTEYVEHREMRERSPARRPRARRALPRRPPHRGLGRRAGAADARSASGDGGPPREAGGGKPTAGRSRALGLPSARLLASRPTVGYLRRDLEQGSRQDGPLGRGAGRGRDGGGHRGALAPAGAAAAAADERQDRGRRDRGPGAGAPRPLGRAPRRGRQPRRPLVRAGLLPLTGPALADGLLPPRRLRSGLRVRRAGGAEGRPVDADPRVPPRRRSRGRPARPRGPRPARELLRRRQRRGRRRQGASVRDAAAAAVVRAMEPASTSSPSAS